LYARVPRRNLLSLRRLLLAEPATAAFWLRAQPVVLGFTRNGAHLLSYTVAEVSADLDHPPGTSQRGALQFWSFSRSCIGLVCELPLFRALPEAVEAVNALGRFSVVESLDQRYFVVQTPSLSGRRSSSARTEFYSVIESPFEYDGRLRREVRAFELVMPSWGQLCDLRYAFRSSTASSSTHTHLHQPQQQPHQPPQHHVHYLAASIGHGVNALQISHTAIAALPPAPSSLHQRSPASALPRDAPLAPESVATVRAVLSCTPPSQESPSASPSSRHVMRTLVRAYPVRLQLPLTECGRELSALELRSGLQVRRAGFFDAEAYLRSRLAPTRLLLGWSNVYLLAYEMRVIRVHADGHLSLLLLSSLARSAREPLAARVAFLVFYHLRKRCFATVYAGSVSSLFPCGSSARHMTAAQVLSTQLSLLSDLLCQSLQAQSTLPQCAAGKPFV
jgi:hypothetical protein